MRQMFGMASRLAKKRCAYARYHDMKYGCSLLTAYPRCPSRSELEMLCAGLGLCNGALSIVIMHVMNAHS